MSFDLLCELLHLLSILISESLKLDFVILLLVDLTIPVFLLVELGEQLLSSRELDILVEDAIRHNVVA